MARSVHQTMLHKSGVVALVLPAPLALGACGKFKSKRAPAAETTVTSGSFKTPAERALIDEDDAVDDTVVSCNSKGDLGMCSEWSGLTRAETKEAKGSCNDPGSVFSKTRCTSDGLLATCEHKEEHVKMFLYKSALVKTVQGARELCEDGEFTVSTNALTPSHR